MQMNDLNRKIKELESKIEKLEQENKLLKDNDNEDYVVLQQEYNSIFHNPNLGIFQYDKKGVITNCNDVFVKIIGSSKEVLMGFNIITQTKDKKMSNSIKEALIKGKSNYNDVYHSVTGNKKSYVNVHFSTVRNKSNEIVGGIGIVEDNTEQRISQELLRKTKEQLKVKLDYILSPDSDIAEIKLSEIIDIQQLQRIQDAFASATGVASLIVDTEGSPITKESNFNEVCNLIRSSKEGIKRCRLSDKSIGEKAMKSLKPVYEKCLSCGFYDAGAPIIVGNKHIATWTIGQGKAEDISAEEMEKYAEEIGVDKSLMLNTFKSLPSVSSDKFESVLNLLWILAKEISTLAYNNIKLARSLEKHKIFEKDLKKAKEKAEDSDRLKTSFLANMSHEIRTPMNAIIGFTDLLGDPDLTYEQREQFIEIINNSGNDLLHLIDDIIDIAKIEANQLKTTILEVNVNHIIDDLHILYQNKIKNDSKDVQINSQKELDNKESIILSDGNRIKQILNNLINNAIKFTSTGTIEFGYELEDSFLKFYVKDTGLGIERELKEVIFERFRQGSEGSIRKYGGTGLGLSISKGLTELLGGKIWLDENYSNGSKFYFTIPYNLVEKNIRDSQLKSKVEISIDFRGKKALIVEDERTNNLFLENILQEIGFNTLLAENGLEALNKFSSIHDLDIILMDIQLPNMNGYEVTQEIRKTNKKIPIIAQTAFAMEEDRLKALDAGCSDYIAKPIRKKELFNIINKLIKKG
jgi:PAS domain S-box-containing protein